MTHHTDHDHDHAETDDHTDADEADLPEWLTDLKPSPMDEYRGLLRRKHGTLVSAKDCPGFDPTAYDKGDHVVVWCRACGALLHRKYREPETEAGTEAIAEGADE